MSERGNLIASVRNVWKSYDQGRVTVLQDVTLEVRVGEVVALWGS
ncbi:MAG: ABC transporter ATP-binding protein, partial [Opitutaceae bacterium]|nr:ABC transporter ATP-binding protein [Opitutaceae bacterium]